MDLNRAQIIGRLTRDPEIRTTQSGVSVASFSVATNFVWNDANGSKKESVEYHDIVAWRKLGEIIGQYLRKGSRVFIEGRLQTRSWDGQDGVKRYRTEIIADNMIMLDSRGAGSGGDNFIQENSQPQNSAQPATQPEQQSPQPQEQSQSQNNEEEISVEDIPF